MAGTLNRVTILELGLCVIAIILRAGLVESSLTVGFYNTSCPRAEILIQNVVNFNIQKDPTLAASLLRLYFHDCFTDCDASLLLDAIPGTRSEKVAAPNLSLRGFEVLDAAKSKVEAVCPGVVSCADIMAFAARDSVVKRGGLRWEVPAGRRDNLISRASDAEARLPPFTADVATLTSSFAQQGLTVDEMITLSGAHSLGRAKCSSYSSRLYSFNSTTPQDPSMDPQYAQQLKSRCPGPSNSDPFENLDSKTPFKFDNQYYNNLIVGRGLLQSDQVLFTDSTTAPTVIANGANDSAWQVKFGLAMVSMSSINVLTDLQGEIRKNCRLAN